jgi:aryl-alcohol dehydrogenase-like predicted oxidoreductase
VQTRPVPGTDLQLSVLALGGWLTIGGAVADAESMRMLRSAVDGGINFVDLADIYADGAAERVVGRFLREHGDATLVVSSKVFWPTSTDPADRGLSRRHIHASIDRSLQHLGRSHLDLYFCHREDPTVSLAETVQAMGDLVAAGKVRAWGTSCWRPATLQRAHRLAAELGVAPPRIEQPQYSLLRRTPELEVIPCCRQLGMAVVAFSPMAGGVLTGKYLDGVPAGSRGATSRWLDEYRGADSERAVRAFVALCREHALAPAVVALAWVMQQPGLTAAIQGASSEAQLRSNLAAATLVLPPALQQALGWLFPCRRSPWWRRALRKVFGRR